MGNEKAISACDYQTAIEDEIQNGSKLLETKLRCFVFILYDLYATMEMSSNVFQWNIKATL